MSYENKKLIAILQQGLKIRENKKCNYSLITTNGRLDRIIYKE